MGGRLENSYFEAALPTKMQWRRRRKATSIPKTLLRKRRIDT